MVIGWVCQYTVENWIRNARTFRDENEEKISSNFQRQAWIHSIQKKEMKNESEQQKRLWLLLLLLVSLDNKWLGKDPSISLCATVDATVHYWLSLIVLVRTRLRLGTFSTANQLAGAAASWMIWLGSLFDFYSIPIMPSHGLSRKVGMTSYYQTKTINYQTKAPLSDFDLLLVWFEINIFQFDGKNAYSSGLIALFLIACW